MSTRPDSPDLDNSPGTAPHQPEGETIDSHERPPPPSQETAAWAARGATVELPSALREHPRYRLLWRLGGGGMGDVYLAEHTRMERRVALKVISGQLLDQPAAVARFLKEVKAAARLEHPNIVRAYDADEAGSLHFLVMEYVEGSDLASEVRRRGAIPYDEACRLIRQAALGLQYAHEQGMVHRDIKPHNVMMTPEGNVKVLDFGLARFAREADDTASIEGNTPDASSADDMTEPGMLMGTADYIAPEQSINARAADIRADIYSLGCTLYHLIAGHVPFPDVLARDKIAAHQFQTPVSLAKVRQNVPPDLVRVVERMMAKSPDDRHQTPAEVITALAPFTKPVIGRAAPIDAIPTPSSVSTPPPKGSKLPAELFEGRIKRDSAPSSTSSPGLAKKRRSTSTGVVERRRGSDVSTLTRKIFAIVLIFIILLAAAYALTWNYW